MSGRDITFDFGEGRKRATPSSSERSSEGEVRSTGQAAAVDWSKERSPQEMHAFANAIINLYGNCAQEGSFITPEAKYTNVAQAWIDRNEAAGLNKDDMTDSITALKEGMNHIPSHLAKKNITAKVIESIEAKLGIEAPGKTPAR